MSGETYLGDGLFVSFDGYHFCLRAQRDNGWHEIYLEPSVLESFNDYVKLIREGSKMKGVYTS